MNSMGNGKAKELICMTHGHELRGWEEECWREGGCRAEGHKGEKKEWDNCNSKINKICFKKLYFPLVVCVF